MHAVKAYTVNRCMVPLILNLHTICRGVVSFMPRSLYHWGKIPPVPTEQEVS
jgi:hypothetical protein